MNTQIVVDVENIKLVPVVKWPLGDFPIELPGLDRYIEVGLIYDVSELRALVVASYPEIKRHVIPTAFDGGFCLMSGTSIWSSLNAAAIWAPSTLGKKLQGWPGTAL
jgi:hypothetical protein